MSYNTVSLHGHIVLQVMAFSVCTLKLNDLQHKLQDLANNAASLSSARGAAFGFASIAKLAGNELQPYLAKTIPKLYRQGFTHQDSSTVVPEQDVP